MRHVLITLALAAAAALSGCAIYSAYPSAVVVGPPVVRVYPAPPPPVVYRPYGYGYYRRW